MARVVNHTLFLQDWINKCKLSRPLRPALQQRHSRLISLSCSLKSLEAHDSHDMLAPPLQQRAIQPSKSLTTYRAPESIRNACTARNPNGPKSKEKQSTSKQTSASQFPVLIRSRHVIQHVEKAMICNKNAC